MHKFCYGDRVVVKNPQLCVIDNPSLKLGMTGTVYNLKGENIGVCWDKPITNGTIISCEREYICNKGCTCGHGYFVSEEDVELLNSIS